MPGVTRSAVAAVLLTLAVLAVYLLTGAADLRHNGDTDLRYQTTQALVDAHHVWVDNPMWYDLRMVPGRGHHLYGYYGPGQVLAMVPLYIAGKAIAHHLGLPYDITTLYAARSLDLWLGALLALVFYLMGRALGYNVRVAAILTLIFAFATAAWPDAQSALEQTQVDLFLLVAVYASVRFVHDNFRSRGWLAVAGLFAGLAFVTRYDAALYLPVLGLFPALVRVARGRTSGFVVDWVIYGLAALPAIAGVAFWDWLRFGTVLDMGLRTPTFGEPIWQGFLGLTVSPGKGLIWYVPLLFFLPWAFPAFVQGQRVTGVLFAALVVIPLLFYSGVLYWHGDPAWGPRYLYATLPYLILPLGAILEGWRRRSAGLRAAFVAVTVISVAIQIAAVSVTQWRFWYHLEVTQQQQVNVTTWSGRPFHWGPQRYHYYWTVAESPVLMQFVDTYQVIRLDMGDRHYYLSGRPDPYVSSASDNYPVNTLNFWWADVRHPLLGSDTRMAIAGVLAGLAIVTLLGLWRTLAVSETKRLPARAEMEAVSAS